MGILFDDIWDTEENCIKAIEEWKKTFMESLDKMLPFSEDTIPNIFNDGEGLDPLDTHIDYEPLNIQG